MAGTFNSYLDFFGFGQRPFSLTPDPEFIYWTAAHRGAYAMLEYGLSTHAPITLLTGEIGAGKTTLLQYFVEALGDDVTLAMVTNTRPGTRDILQWLLPELADEDPADERVFKKVMEFFIHEYNEGRRVVLIIDEAQNLSHQALEELRMLTNINVGKDDVLQLYLVGQPELRDMVRRPDLIQFAQRVAANYHIPVMDPPTVGHYIAHRVKVAGGQPNVFSKQAAELIHEHTAGVPRLVNQLCDLSLTYAYAHENRMVKRQIVQSVIDDGIFFSPLK
ncbi:Type II secretory pathway, component ExeA (predicted ATPase) [Roseicitreum antarcticum]|uniref:Type II secretory pathway, component ExeA (Predicted ATPase) n=2 Tax=Roseicitreum antarcticum TaxID=564137 RepID=A0A1H2WIU6_9RHOB|nr:Type II secretory pathway, component ExeA (predicted ATPase) [Roseicitreum antarcticum]